MKIGDLLSPQHKNGKLIKRIDLSMKSACQAVPLSQD